MDKFLLLIIVNLLVPLQARSSLLPYSLKTLKIQNIIHTLICKKTKKMTSGWVSNPKRIESDGSKLF